MPNSMIEQAFAALTRSAASGSKATALAPLLWILALTSSGLLTAAGLAAPAWVSVFFGTLSGLTFVVALLTFVYLLRYNLDALRSERFAIAKLRIERGVMGDTTSGFSQIHEAEARKALQSGQSALDV